MIWPNFDISTDIKHAKYLREAYIEAKKSIDPSTQIGAILICNDGNILIRDFNNFTKGFPVTKKILEDRNEKKKYIEHAERNVIFKAAREGIITNNTTLYCTWFSCKECARAIVQAGISSVVGHKIWFDLTPQSLHRKLDESFNILRLGGVKCILYNGIVESESVYFKGEKINPDLTIN